MMTKIVWYISTFDGKLSLKTYEKSNNGEEMSYTIYKIL